MTSLFNNQNIHLTNQTVLVSARQCMVKNVLNYLVVDYACRYNMARGALHAEA